MKPVEEGLQRRRLVGLNSRYERAEDGVLGRGELATRVRRYECSQVERVLNEIGEAGGTSGAIENHLSRRTCEFPRDRILLRLCERAHLEHNRIAKCQGRVRWPASYGESEVRCLSPEVRQFGRESRARSGIHFIPSITWKDQVPPRGQRRQS